MPPILCTPVIHLQNTPTRPEPVMFRRLPRRYWQILCPIISQVPNPTHRRQALHTRYTRHYLMFHHDMLCRSVWSIDAVSYYSWISEECSSFALFYIKTDVSKPPKPLQLLRLCPLKPAHLRLPQTALSQRHHTLFGVTLLNANYQADCTAGSLRIQLTLHIISIHAGQKTHQIHPSSTRPCWKAAEQIKRLTYIRLVTSVLSFSFILLLSGST